MSIIWVFFTKLTNRIYYINNPVVSRPCISAEKLLSGSLDLFP